MSPAVTAFSTLEANKSVIALKSVNQIALGIPFALLSPPFAKPWFPTAILAYAT